MKKELFLILVILTNTILQSAKDSDQVVPEHKIISRKNLMNACRIGDINTVRTAISQHININHHDEEYEGETPLIAACINQHLEIVLLLINSGANVNLINTNQYTALHTVCENGDARIAGILLANGANPLLSNLENVSPLMIACSNNYLDIVNLLLANNSTNINQQSTDEFGLTALHYACQHNFTQLIEPLLDHGANIDIENSDEMSAYEMSQLLDDREIQLIFDAHLEALE